MKAAVVLALTLVIIAVYSPSALCRPENNKPAVNSDDVEPKATPTKQSPPKPDAVKVKDVCEWGWTDCWDVCRSLGFPRGGCDDWEECYCWDVNAPTPVRASRTETPVKAN